MQVLLLREHGHHDERVQVDAFTQHPEIVAAQHVHVEEMQHFAAHLQRAEQETEASHRSSGRKAHVFTIGEAFPALPTYSH